MSVRVAASALALALALAACRGPRDRTAGSLVRVGSKQFTESVLLGELARALADSAGARAAHLRELGGTRVLWNALLAGEIDVYPEYTGTLRQEILAAGAIDDAGLRKALAGRGVRMGSPLGFNNTYAIGMKEQRAAALGIARIGELARHPALSFGFTSEFMDRADGWPGLRAHYQLAPAQVRGLDHDLAYRGLATGTIDVTDVYSTDAEIEHYGLRVLRDDRGYFPEYQAVLLYREAFVRADPRLHAQLERLAGSLDERAMQRLNAAVKIGKRTEAEVAAEFLKQRLQVRARVARTSPLQDLLRHTRDHLALVGLSLSAAVLVAVPLGVLAARRRALGQVILSLTGVLQTIPSLALLVFMIPVFGIGAPPAVAALFLYSLLPIVRNTQAGLRGIAPSVLESAEALGLPAGARLRLVELPLASPSILAGIKTSAVINVGTATLGALIGAGGYGQPILTGIRLDDHGLILQGAIPAAVLALFAQWLFDLAERKLVPRGLRIRA
jgi:osmoprotectant transport system permease protein